MHLNKKIFSFALILLLAITLIPLTYATHTDLLLMRNGNCSSNTDRHTYYPHDWPGMSCPSDDIYETVALSSSFSLGDLDGNKVGNTHLSKVTDYSSTCGNPQPTTSKETIMWNITCDSVTGICSNANTYNFTKGTDTQNSSSVSNSYFSYNYWCNEINNEGKNVTETIAYTCTDKYVIEDTTRSISYTYNTSTPEGYTNDEQKNSQIQLKDTYKREFDVVGTTINYEENYLNMQKSRLDAKGIKGPFSPIYKNNFPVVPYDDIVIDVNIQEIFCEECGGAVTTSPIEMEGRIITKETELSQTSDIIQD